MVAGNHYYLLFRPVSDANPAAHCPPTWGRADFSPA
jgi:hypothetical protein